MANKEVEEWLAIRKEAGLRIDPETAEVTWVYAQTLDPYGIHLDLPEECQQVGREYFARSPGSEVWVLFDDLPEATREALWGLLGRFPHQGGRPRRSSGYAGHPHNRTP